MVSPLRVLPLVVTHSDLGGEVGKAERTVHGGGVEERESEGESKNHSLEFGELFDFVLASYPFR
jgi:hypothetical protein